MKVVVGSAFRNSGRATQQADGSTQASRAVERVRKLGHAIGRQNVRMVAAEGDSTDDTIDQLRAAADRYDVDLTIVDVSHGGPMYGSTEQPERMRLLSGVGNGIMRSVRDDDQLLLYVESDLIWTPSVVRDLADIVLPSMLDGDEAKVHGMRIGAPIIMAGPHFYDVWGFRGLDGQRWGPCAPYHRERNPVGLTEVSSAGSCLLMPARAAMDAPPMTDGALVEWCTGARSIGYHIMVHPFATVRHPA